MSTFEEKVWGHRWILHSDSTHETSILKVKAGHRCSWHVHQTKWNVFGVVSGQFEVLVGPEGFNAGPGVGESFLVAPGEPFKVRPGVYHEFRAHTDCVVVEEMYTEYDASDIERQNQGGKIEDAAEPQGVNAC